MNSKRVNGHRLLFVIALIGILSTHVISAQDDDTTVAATEGVSEPAATEEVQSTAEDLTAATGVETVTSVARETPEASIGEMGISTEASDTVATAGGVAETTAGPSVAVGGDGADTTATGAQGGLGPTVSTEDLSTTGTESVQVQTGSDATAPLSVGSSRGGIEDGPTTIFTGAPSTGEPEVAAKQEYTTGRAAAEETTTFVEKTNETATATSVGHTGTEGQTQTTRKETDAAVMSTLAPPGMKVNCSEVKTKDTEKTRCDIDMNQNSTGWTTNTTIVENKGEPKYNYTVTHVVSSKDETIEPKKSTCTYNRTDPYEVNSRDVESRLLKKLKEVETNISVTRRRRQADGATRMTMDHVMKALVDVFDDIMTDSPKQTPSQDPAKAPAPNPITSGTVWEAHYGFFLTVVILISVCVVVTAVCCLCIAWRRRGQDKHSDKQPIAMEEAREAPVAVSNPIPDDEMIQDEAPMQERENPAVTPNGGGQHISKADEDNGWVVPLDELSKAEKEKPEVENTRL